MCFLFSNFNIKCHRNQINKNVKKSNKTKYGDVKIELFEDVAPNHVKRIKDLANSGKYDNVVFHRVIDGFMANGMLNMSSCDQMYQNEFILVIGFNHCSIHVHVCFQINSLSL